MVDIEKINWTESQNSFSIASRKTFGRNIYYNYFNNHQKKTYTMGRFRYTIGGDIEISNVDKELFSTGIDADGKEYYWHYFHNSCCFDKSLNYDAHPKLKNDRFIVKKVNEGKWNFNHNAYACITRTIAELKSQLKPNQSLIVLFPTNKLISKEAQKKYQTEFIKLLIQDNITFVVDDINKIEEKEKQLVIIIIDLISTIKRKNYIIKDIRNKKANQKPLIAMYSLVVIFDEKVGRFCVNLKSLRKKQNEEKADAIFTKNTPTRDEEGLIMKSLAGYGPDPEIFGF